MGKMKDLMIDKMNKEIDLLDCPFCGERITEDMIDLDNYYFYQVSCDCGVKNEGYNTVIEAKKAWNKRAYKPKQEQ